MFDVDCEYSTRLLLNEIIWIALKIRIKNFEYGILNNQLRVPHQNEIS